MTVADHPHPTPLLSRGREPALTPTLSQRERGTNVRAKISLREVHKRFVTPGGETYEALGGVSLDVCPGEFVSVVGPGGCGKSTLLRLVAGRARPGDGEE